jgi:hypothetical protein
MQDFCYYANAIFVTSLLFFPNNDKLFLVCFSFAEVSATLTTCSSCVLLSLAMSQGFSYKLFSIIVNFKLNVKKSTSNNCAGTVGMGTDCLAV